MVHSATTHLTSMSLWNSYSSALTLFAGDLAIIKEHLERFIGDQMIRLVASFSPANDFLLRYYLFLFLFALYLEVGSTCFRLEGS